MSIRFIDHFDGLSPEELRAISWMDHDVQLRRQTIAAIQKYSPLVAERMSRYPSSIELALDSTTGNLYVARVQCCQQWQYCELCRKHRQYHLLRQLKARFRSAFTQAAMPAMYKVIPSLPNGYSLRDDIQAARNYIRTTLETVRKKRRRLMRGSRRQLFGGHYTIEFTRTSPPTWNVHVHMVLITNDLHAPLWFKNAWSQATNRRGHIEMKRKPDKVHSDPDMYQQWLLSGAEGYVRYTTKAPAVSIDDLSEAVAILRKRGTVPSPRMASFFGDLHGMPTTPSHAETDRSTSIHRIIFRPARGGWRRLEVYPK